MEDQSTAEERKQKTTDRDRQAAKRARDKAIASGTYIKTPLELAKEFLSAQAEPDVKTIENNPELSAALTDDHRKQLVTFLNNLRQKRKREREELAHRHEQ